MYASGGGGGGPRNPPRYGYGSNNGRYGDAQVPFGSPDQGGGGAGDTSIAELLGSIMRWPFDEGTMDPVFNGQMFGSGNPAPPVEGSSAIAEVLKMFQPGGGRQKIQQGQMFQNAPEPEQPQMSPDQAALAQLYELVTGQGDLQASMEEDLQASLAESAAGINKQYGAEIGALRHANQGARQDTKAGSAEVQRLYGALANSYNRAGKQEMRQGNRLSNRLQNMGERAQGSVTDQATQLNESSAAAAEGLGLADLGQELVGQNNRVAQQQSKVAGSRGQMAANTALGQAGNNRTYMQTGGMSSRLEGTNQSADMYAQLQDYLQSNRSQMASLAGERAQAQAAANASITGQYASAQDEGQQQTIENLMALFGMGQQVQNSQFDQNMALQELASQGAGGSGSGSDPYELLPDQVAGPAELLNNFGSPRVNKLFGDVSSQGGMGTGYFNNGGNTNVQQSLQGNYQNMAQYVQQIIGPEQWSKMGEAGRNTLISALLLRLEGMTTTQSQP